MQQSPAPALRSRAGGSIRICRRGTICVPVSHLFIFATAKERAQAIGQARQHARLMGWRPTSHKLVEYTVGGFRRREIPLEAQATPDRVPSSVCASSAPIAGPAAAASEPAVDTGKPRCAACGDTGLNAVPNARDSGWSVQPCFLGCPRPEPPAEFLAELGDEECDDRDPVSKPAPARMPPLRFPRGADAFLEISVGHLLQARFAIGTIEHYGQTMGIFISPLADLWLGVADGHGGCPLHGPGGWVDLETADEVARLIERIPDLADRVRA